MTPTIRLLVIAVIIIISAAYAVTVVKDPDVAAAVASGYVALVLTAIILVHFWRKP